jgi:hypothetical protein
MSPLKNIYSVVMIRAGARADAEIFAELKPELH